MCKRNGCRKKYKESENKEDSCIYHSGKPIFHDTKKGWTCCNKLVYDWDEFEKIEGCIVAAHSDVKVVEKDGEFYQSNTVSNAKSALKKSMQPTTTIEEYNKKQAELKEEKEKKEEKKVIEEKTYFKTANGKLRCINKGCLKEFDEGDDSECNYHPGNPIFHDFKKSWSCCKKVAYEFDEFLKLPTCAQGKHQPKMV